MLITPRKYTVHLIYGSQTKKRDFDDLTKAKKAVEKYVKLQEGRSGKLYTEGEPGFTRFDGKRWVED